MKPLKTCCLAAAALAAMALAGAAPAAAKSPRQTFHDECGACHWAYLPGLLPARSWKKITSNLSHHFGQNASLDKKTTEVIQKYLIAHAGDAPGHRDSFMRGLRPGETPLRITSMPVWRAIHGSPHAAAFSDPRVKTAANCGGCHRVN